MTYRRWDVVVVGYPFIEGDTAKRRPALIVSSDALHVAHGVYWIVMITTARAGARAEDIQVTDHRKAGLPMDCVIRVPRLTTLGEAQILYRRGSITVKDRNAVASLLKKYLP
ncbi:MAG: type II toxin-antitoxin system PemK/MazF family toxin [Kiloniellales bacterium]